jgi:predicted ribonuclease YlaK
MTASKKNGPQQGYKLTRRRMRTKPPIGFSAMSEIKPLTPNQERIFRAWDEGKHLFIYGAAGTGKSFVALYKALYDCLKEIPSFENIHIVRSLVATREIGFLPGDHDDKSDIYQIPYKHMVKYMFEQASDDAFEMLYSNLKGQETIKFWSTSFLRGVTLDNTVILVDEFQNLSGHELDSILTRVGENTRIVFCGDIMQTDLTREKEKNGVHDFMRILEMMPESFEMIEMGIEDICRSKLIKDYIIAKTNLGIKFS